LIERKDAPGVLGSYLSLVRGFGEGLYPGSPLLTLKLLRAKDRLVAVEKQDDECRHLQALLADEPRAHVICGDGYSVLRKLLPLAERRGVVLIDPPYEAENEFALATRALTDFYRRFATGIFLLWYPAKERAHVEAAIGEILTAGLRELIQLELDIGDGGEGRLDTTGLLVVNPPYGFASEMRAVGVFLAENLGIDNAAVFRSTILAGEG
jgi:23S rRNA (adenine2030-N6)-methyltransferase